MPEPQMHHDLDDSANLVRLLQSVRPVRCDALQAETFYRAGWAAALREQSQSATPRSAHGRTGRQSSHRFVVGILAGMVCGLLCGISASAWWAQYDIARVSHGAISNSNVQDPGRNRHGHETSPERHPPALPGPPAGRDSDQGLLTASEPLNLLTTWFPLLYPETVAEPAPVAAAFHPLSAVARRSWRLAMQRESQRLRQIDTGTSSSGATRVMTPMLTPFSMHELQIEDLL